MSTRFSTGMAGPDAVAALNALDDAAAAYVNAVRFDSAQSLTSPQKLQARTNIGLDAAVTLTDVTLAGTTAISGGTINNTTIGATTAAAVTGTAVTATTGFQFDDSLTYTNRNAVLTLSRNTASPTGIFPAMHVIAQGKGDNATFIGVSGAYFQARDRNDVTGSNKGVLYGLQATVSPKVARNNVPYDDIACIVMLNDAQVAGAKGTEACYIGHNAVMFPTDADFEFITAYSVEANTQIGLQLAGSHIHGIETKYGRFTGYALHLKNNLFIGARNATDSADITLLGLDASNVVRLNGLAVTASTGTLTIPNSATLATAGAYSLTLTATAATNVTLPTTGTLATLAGSETLTNKTISGSSNTLSSIGNSSLTNSAVTVNGTSISLGASATVTAAAGTLTGTTLNSTVVTSSLTSVGTLGTLRISGADASSPLLGVSGTTKGVRFTFSSGGSGIDGVDNTLVGSFQPLVLNGTTVSLSSSGSVVLASTSSGVAITGAFRLITSFTPASASSTGSAGQIAWDSSYIYLCTATDTWKRAAVATW